MLKRKSQTAKATSESRYYFFPEQNWSGTQMPAFDTQNNYDSGEFFQFSRDCFQKKLSRSTI